LSGSEKEVRGELTRIVAPGKGESVRKFVAIVVVALSVAAPAHAVSLMTLEPNERENMLTTCNRLPGNDRSLCRNVVDDQKVIANYKRGCLEAMTLLLKDTAWAVVKSMPAALSCRQGLAQAGYPVGDIMRRLTGGMDSAQR
jgi:hypothetical protein